jgi:hypothetical protein
MKVTLLRPFWGHAKGTQGSVRNGKLFLKGSPPAKVLPQDEGDLYGTREPTRKAG